MEASGALARLVDRAGIEDAVRAYAASVDLDDLEGLAGVLHPDVHATYTGFEPKRGRDEVLAWITSRTDDLRYQHHFVSPYRIEVEGDRATCLVYLVSHQLRADSLVRLMTSRYSLELLRVPESRVGWQISELRLEVGIDERRPGNE